MSLLNFANTYEEVSGYLQLPESNTGDYVKLVFTKDGHIISHGVDYTPLFSTGKKGLVPGSTGKVTEFLRGNGTWASITTADLPIATSISEAISQNKTTSTILNTQQIIDYVSNSFAANDAMRYKGTIAYEDGAYYTHTTEGVRNEGFPTQCQIGDTYRITTSATYAGQECEAGDLMACIKDGTGSSLNTAEYWTVVQTNINGEVVHSINGTSYYFYSNSGNKFNIYAPTTGGTQNQILMSNGNSAPTWINQSSIIAGNITDAAKKALLTNVSLSNTGVVSVSVGGTTLSSSAASGTWNISVTGQANRVANDLSAGNGLQMGTQKETYNGSAARTISLKPARRTLLGGVIIDRDNEEDSKTISVDTTGNIFLTPENIINALGYTPGSSETLIYSQVLASTSSSTTQTDTSILNPYINTIQISGSNRSVTSSYQLIGLDGIRIDAQDSIKVRLAQATDSVLGGIKIGYTTSDKNYAVQLSESGQAYVNVPWLNTTYGLATATQDGLVPKFDAVGTGSLINGSWVLAKLPNGVYDWFALPSQAFTDTWRTIQVQGTQLLSSQTNSGVLNFQQGGHTTVTGSGNTITISSSWRDITIGGTSIGEKTLNFIPTGDIYVKADITEDDVQDISFGLSWYNISNGNYEYDQAHEQLT